MNILILLLLCFVPMLMGVRRSTPPAPTCAPFPALAHGSFFSRNHGRTVRFYCNRPFQIVGFRYSTCISSGWTHPAPICVLPSSGCPVPSIDKGSVWSTHDDAWLEFYCLPGFKLVGSPALYCDGTSWNGTAPSCVIETTEVQLSCNFERDLCGWRQDDTHDFDWTRHNMKTPSFSASTGPSYDHTFGNSSEGYYMYIESSTRLNNNSARLVSPIFSSNLTQDGCFSLFYHMYGSYIGGLRVYQIPETSRQIVHLSEVEKQDHLLFEKWGDQGNNWFRNVSTLRNTNSNFQIVIEGICGLSFTSDVAIDDVAILQGDQCRDASITAVTPSDLPPETCRGRCEMSSPPSPRAACGCTVACMSNETCCPDYYEQCIFGLPTQTSTKPLTTTTTNEWTTDQTVEWTTPRWTDDTSEAHDNEDSTDDQTELSTETTTDLSWTFPLPTNSTPPPHASPAAPTPQTTKSPSPSKPVTTTRSNTSTSTTTITTTTEQDLFDDIYLKTTSASDDDEDEEVLQENVPGNSVMPVTLIVLVICVVTVGLVILLTLRNYGTICSKARRLHPFSFRATFTPNSRERGNASEIPINEYGSRSLGAETCMLRENSLNRGH